MNRARFKADIITNVGLSFLVAAASLLVVKGAAKELPATMLGAFLFTRRVADAASSLLQLGTAFVIRREVARNTRVDDRLLFTITGALILAAVAIAVALLILSCGPWLASLLFPSLTEGAEITRLLGLITVGLTLHYFASSLLFAQRRIVAANLLQLANTGGWLLAGLYLWRSHVDVVRLLRLQGIASILLGTLVIIAITARFAHEGGRVRNQDIPKALREYAAYGLPRAVSPFGEMLIFLVGPWLLRANLSEAGYLLIALTLVRMVQALIQPASNVIGIVSAALSGVGDDAKIHRGLRLLLGLLGGAGLATAVLVLPWLDVLLGTWLGDSSVVAGVMPYARVLVLTIPAVVIFQGLKEPIEMLWHAPRNLASIGLGLIVLLGSYYACLPFVGSVNAIIVAQAASIIAIGLMTVVWVRQALPSTGYFGVPRFLLALFAAGGANAAVARLVNPIRGPALLAPLSAMATASLVVLALTIYRRPSPFVRDLTTFVRH
ncbi:MAG: Na+-driven multidrug efflux pump [Gemmatimonadales bacterium]|nr:Na+-driven multidrug efflux pump [Gemmatimonadales bacterium]